MCLNVVNCGNFRVTFCIGSSRVLVMSAENQLTTKASIGPPQGSCTEATVA